MIRTVSSVQVLFSARISFLSSVQTCLKRIRLDMPLTHEDYPSQDGERPEHTWRGQCVCPFRQLHCCRTKVMSSSCLLHVSV